MLKKILRLKTFLILTAIFVLVGSVIAFLPKFSDKLGKGLHAEIPRVKDSNDPDYKYEFDAPVFKLLAGEEQSDPKVEIRQGNRTLELIVSDKPVIPAAEEVITPEPTVEPSVAPTETPQPVQDKVTDLLVPEVKAQESLSAVNTDNESYIQFADYGFKLKPGEANTDLEFTVAKGEKLPVLTINPLGLEGFNLNHDVVFATRTNRKAYSINSVQISDANGDSTNIEAKVEKSDAPGSGKLELVNFDVSDEWLKDPKRVFPLTITAKLNALFDKKMLPMKPTKETFSANENLEFEIDTLFINDLTVQSKILSGNFDGIRFGLIDTRGETVELNAKLKEKNGDIAVIELSTRRPMVKAGLFDLLLQYQDKPAYISESEVAWGVLAINPDQSVYKTGSTANLDFAVLNRHGMMVCDAKLSLTITEPDGNQVFYSTDAGDIVVTNGCKERITDLPDFTAKYGVGGAGDYKLDLISETADGTYQIIDHFKVDDNSPFYVKRKSHTRIFPWITYGMEIEVTKGTATGNVFITEKFDKDFLITQTNGEEMPPVGEYKTIVWIKDFSQNESYTLGYRYDAPDKSPAMLLLGPLTINSKLQITNDKETNNEIFNEGRAWQIAVDAVDVLNSGTTYAVPSAWNDSNNTIEVIAGGGAGSTGTSNNVPSGGGGGGGVYGKSVNINMPEGSNVTYAIGAGGATSGANGGNTWICNNTTSCANYTDTNVVASARGGIGASSQIGGSGGDTTGKVFNNTTENGSGTVESLGGTGGNGDNNVKGRGGGGGGGAAGPNGTGKTGGSAGNVTAAGGGGGGGNGGGANGTNSSSSSGGGGGNGSGGSGGGGGGTGNTACGSGGDGGNGSSGGGGGGGGSFIQGGAVTGTACTGGTGSQGTEWTGAGSGGGGGGGGGNTRTTSTGNNAGPGGNPPANIGSGGGGGGSCGDSGCTAGSFGAGASGVIILTYTPVGPTMADVMRHGNWFSGGAEQSFFWAQ